MSSRDRTKGKPFPVVIFAIPTDLKEFLSRKCDGLNYIQNLATEFVDDTEVVVFLKLHLLLYADDTVILAETPNDLQISLNNMAEYCKDWELCINVTKTQVMTFSRGKIRKRNTFYFEKIKLVNTDCYKYMGIIFNDNGKFRVAKQDLLLKGKRAMFALITKARKRHLPIDVQLELFDAVVTPVVLYGSEIWCNEGWKTLEKLHLQFCKIIL